MEDAHMQPTARMAATESLVRKFICRFQTMKTGRMPSVQSATQEIAE